MIDREYVKVNTSIQTGSNAENPITDEDGNIEAVIDLRLPENFFNKSTGARKVDHVELKPTKLRLSMENTPIAQLPLDEEKTRSAPVDGTLVSDCQLDVYPFSLTEDGQLLPYRLENTVFPHYKDHYNYYRIMVFDSIGDADQVETVTSHCNTPTANFPTENRFYSVLKQAGFIDYVDNHLMNLCSAKNHETLERTGSEIFVKSIGTLEQFLQNALENAITYASTSSEMHIVIKFVRQSALAAREYMPPVSDIAMEIPEIDEPIYYWTWETTNSELQTSSATCHLINACKPRVILGPQSLTISYDSAAFDTNIPIIWNTSFVETYEHPTQMTLDQLRKQVWSQPPPKRIYKYGVNVGSDPTTYNFTLPPEVTCAAMNIIANKSLRDTMSFLPWIPLDLHKLYDDLGGAEQYKYQVVETMLKEESLNTNVVDQRFYFKAGSSSPDSVVAPFKHMLQFSLIPGNPDYWQYVDPYGISPGYITLTKPGFVYAFQVDVTEYEASPEYDGDTFQTFLRIPDRFRYEQTIKWGPITFTNGETYVTPPAISSETTTNTPATVLSTLTDYKTNDTSLTPGTETLRIDMDVETVDVTGPNVDAQTPEYVGANTGLFAISRWWHVFHDNDTDQWISRWEYSRQPGGHWRNLQQLNSGGWGGSIIDLRNMGGDVYMFRQDSNWTYEILGYTTDQHVDPETGHTMLHVHIFYKYDEDWPDYPQTKPSEYESLDLPMYVEVYRNCSTEMVTDTHTVVHTDTYTRTVTDLMPGQLPMQELNQLYPNLTIDANEPFYILDGTSAQVSIGEQEVVGEAHYIYRTTVTEAMQEGSTRAVTRTATLGDESEPPYYLRRSNNVGAGFFIPDVVNIQGCVLYEYWYPRDVGDVPEHRINYLVTIGGEVTYNELQISEPLVLEREVIQPQTPISPLPEPTVTVTTSTSGVPGHEETTVTQTTENVIDLTVKTGQVITKYYLETAPTAHTGECAWSGKEVTDINAPPNLWVPDDNVTAPCYIYTDDIQRDGVWYVQKYIYYQMPGGEAHQGDPNLGNANIQRFEGVVFDKTIETVECQMKTTTDTVAEIDPDVGYTGNIRLSFIWDNLPMVVLSPIASIVLSLQGIQLNQEYQPINMPDETRTGSSLTSVVPVVENYYSLASTLRDLHDELVVAHDEFDTTPTYTLPSTGGQERSLRLSAMYITKDGSLRKIYIPPNGVFSVQLTFALALYQTS